MSRTDAEKRAQAAAGQDQLPGLVIDRGPVRRTEDAVARACKLAHDAGDLVDADTGAATLAVELARAMDVASSRGDPYASAAVARELREQLVRLRLDPASRGAVSGDPFDALLAQLGPSST